MTRSIPTWRFIPALLLCVLPLAANARGQEGPRDGGEAQAVAEAEGPYLVITVALDEQDAEHRVFLKVAEQAAAFHEGEVLPFDGEDFVKLRAALRERRPRHVLIVIPPQALDVTFHRRFVQITAGLDEDIFPDFAFGYFTARDGAALEKLWQRTLRLHEHGLPAKRWVEASVVGGGAESFRQGAEAISDQARAAGFDGEAIYWGIAEADPDVLQFVDENLPRLEGAGVVTLWGNGDPQGVWLFDDQRNLDETKHWAFDPEKVGQHPETLVRITADRFRELDLGGAIVWSGTCHCGATHRVLVEGDIVSTFGASDVVELYEMPPEESMCLALLDAGAGALLVPIASNNGTSVTLEHWHALGEGATLGDAMKFSYDDVILQAGGLPPLVIAHPGDAPKWGVENPMAGGAINRLLIGDPALDLFTPTANPGEKVTVEERDGGLAVTVDWDAGTHPMGWNLYGPWGGPSTGRIYTRLDVTDLWPADRPLGGVTVTVTAGGAAVQATPRWALEEFHGRRYLHLQAEAPRERLDQRSRRALFQVHERAPVHVPAPADERAPVPELAGMTPDALFQLGMHPFNPEQRDVDSALSLRALKAAADHPDATKDQRRVAMFYLAVLQHNTGRLHEQVATFDQWLREVPKEDDLREYALWLQVRALWQMGERTRARELLELMKADYPEGDQMKEARRLIEGE